MARVSICTAVLDMSGWLRECIASVVSQTYSDWEMIIVDDASTEDIASVVNSFNDPRIILHRLSENTKGVGAIDKALRLASGEFVFPLSADEWITPYKLSEQVEFMDANPGIGCVFGLPQVWGDGPHGYLMPKDSQYEQKAYNRSRDEWVFTLMTMDSIPLSSASAMWRSSVFDAIGYFDPRLRMAADLEFYIRMCKEFDISIQPRVWAGSKVRNDGTSISAATPKNLAIMRGEMDIVGEKHEAGIVKLPFDGKVIIATPFYEMKGFSPYIESLVKTITVLERLKIKWDYWALSGDSYVDRARNTICARFIEDESATDLFFIDSDHSWSVLGLLRMLICKEEIVGASYPVKNDWEQWTAVLKMKDGVPVGRVTNGNALLEAHRLPAGFLRIKKSALLKFRDGYPELLHKDRVADKANPERDYTAFFERYRKGEEYLREDFAFSERWTAIGGTLWVEPSVSITHFGNKGWFGNLDGWYRSLKEKKAA